jgi:hypothetical protein
LGVSHSFRLAQMGFEDSPVLKDVTITPLVVLSIDHRQLTQSTRFASVQYGLYIDYDLSEALKIPAKYGRLRLTGFVHFRDAFPAYENHLRDHLYGGIRLAYSN